MEASRRRSEICGQHVVLVAAARTGLTLILVLLFSTQLCAAQTVRGQQHAVIIGSIDKSSGTLSNRTRYVINLALNFDERTYTGTERVYWVNGDDRPTSTLYFHLYANLRSDVEQRSSSGTPVTKDAEAATTDQPHLEISEARAASTGQPLAFTLDDERTTLRVQLGEEVAANGSIEIDIKFAGAVPEVDAEEAGLLAHVAQQVDSVLRDQREVRQARDTNFRCRDVIVLGAAYPVLAVRTGGEWQRKVEPSVREASFTEVADYDVTVNAAPDLKLFASAAPVSSRVKGEGGERRSSSSSESEHYHHLSHRGHKFAGRNLRDFAIVAGRTLRSEERTVANVTVRSIFEADHKRTGRRVLDTASEAVRVYQAHFGQLPFQAINIVEAPLPAGLGHAKFAGLGLIASAFYVDFDRPAMHSLPEIVREQRASIEDSLEFTAAHVVAHQWWGEVVGSDTGRQPVLDEALANWSALLYYDKVRGAERAATARNDQLRGVYEIYRTFGGEDAGANRDAHEYRNSFQYAAIVSGKGALMFEALRSLMGDNELFTALRRFYEANQFEIADLDDLRGACVAEAPLMKRRAVTRTFNRWLSEKHGDEDVAPPSPQLAMALGVTTTAASASNEKASTGGQRNAFSRLGRFFWRQMTRIR